MNKRIVAQILASLIGFIVAQTLAYAAAEGGVIRDPQNPKGKKKQKIVCKKCNNTNIMKKWLKKNAE